MTEELVQKILGGDRQALARALTLVESSKPEHRALANDLLRALYPHSGGSLRLGVSGVPGVGKSTFIDGMGSWLATKGHRVAVLAVDPSSAVTGGSILGDKTRMSRLSREGSAFIRPTPTRGSLGGVAQRSPEAILLCEAAGFDVVFVETVGVGQSEALVAELVDLLILLILPGAGDELQGIKRGILELVDLVVVNKADGDRERSAELAVNQYTSALAILRGLGGDGRAPSVLACSSKEDRGFEGIWDEVEQLRARAVPGQLAEKRRRQRVRWMWRLVEEGLLQKLREGERHAEIVSEVEAEVAGGSMLPADAAKRLLEPLG